MEALVAAVVLSLAGAMTASLLLGSRKVLMRERERQKALLLVFGKAQEVLTTPFPLLPPQVVPEGVKELRLPFPAQPESIRVTDGEGEPLAFRFSEKDGTVSLSPEKSGPAIVYYTARVDEGEGWTIWLRGEFVTPSLSPSPQPTPLKRLFLWGEKGAWKTHPLWVLRGR